VAKQAGNDHPTGVPTGVFPSSDGHFNIAAASTRVWERLCDALGKSEWKTQPQWNTGAKRSDDRKALGAAIAEVTKHKPSAHWVELLEEAGVPCGPINSIDQTFADPQVKHLGIATPMVSKKHGTFNVVASPINMEGLKKDIRIPTGEAGQDTDEILRGIGYTDAKLAELRSKRVI
jgi:formyl-CoA transferase